MRKAALGAVLTTTLLLAAPATALATTSSWFSGDYDVLLGYGCTTFELEPFDARFDCPAGYRVHEAIDFDTPIGTPVFAGWPGTVVTVGGPETHDYGPHYVLIALDEGHDILLGHLSRADVVAGQKLRVGDRIGLTGDLGECNWPNLHFEARVHGGTTYQSLDPSAFLQPAPALPVAAVHDAPVVTVEGDSPPLLPVGAALLSVYLLAWRWRRARRLK
ncbi:MAG TPA: M23 family metallopeptidase [Candidatus Dormibacteraeota bacterium]